MISYKHLQRFKLSDVFKRCASVLNEEAEFEITQNMIIIYAAILALCIEKC